MKTFWRGAWRWLKALTPPPDSHYNEMYLAGGTVRSHYQALAEWIAGTPPERSKRRPRRMQQHAIDAVRAVALDVRAADGYRQSMATSRLKKAAARLAAIVALFAAVSANSADWVEVGADTQAKYAVDVDSIKVDGENVSVLKRGIFTQVLTDTLGGASMTFKETIGTIEIDCARRINRVIRIDMIGENGELVWSSGELKKRLWEDVRPNTHAETTIEVVCSRLKKN